MLGCMTRPSKARRVAIAVALFVSTALVILGLAVVAGFVLIVVGLNNYGSNK